METLLGRPPPPINSLLVSEYGTETVLLVAQEQSSFWKSIDVDSCLPSTSRTICPPGAIFDCFTAPRTQSPTLAGIAFDYPAISLFTMPTEQLRNHRQAFIYSEEKLNSLPLLHDIAELFKGHVASTLDIPHTPCVVHA